MVVNIPIKLVRMDTGLIPLNVTSLTMDVDRGVTAHSMPLGGGTRWAWDANAAKSAILLEGIITDEDLVTNYTEVGSKASASVDFASMPWSDSATAGLPLITTDGANGYDWNFYASIMTVDEFNTSRSEVPILTLKSESGSLFSIYFIKSNTTYGYTDDKYFVSIHNGSAMRTANAIAVNLSSLINSTTNSSALKTEFTATVENSDVNTPGAYTQVNIEQNAVGITTNGTSPSWNPMLNHARTTKFVGGATSSAEFTNMSAGDKVMYLYAILNNSNNGGISVMSDETKFGVDHQQRKRGDMETTGSARNIKYGDYIVGIQVPFNSTYGNTTGDKYVAKNFFMPTGGQHNIYSKSLTQAKLASSSIDDADDADDNAFIKGAITKATFVQQGGEPIYTFNIQFVPIDYII